MGNKRDGVTGVDGATIHNAGLLADDFFKLSYGTHDVLKGGSICAAYVCGGFVTINRRENIAGKST